MASRPQFAGLLVICDICGDGHVAVTELTPDGAWPSIGMECQKCHHMTCWPVGDNDDDEQEVI